MVKWTPKTGQSIKLQTSPEEGKMAGQKRKTYTAAIKAQVALAALKGDQTVNELASQHSVHPTLLHAWKKQLLAGGKAVFADGGKAVAEDAQAAQAQLFEQIGRLKVELDGVKKNLPNSAEARRLLVDPGHPDLSVCRLPGPQPPPLAPVVRRGWLMLPTSILQPSEFTFLRDAQ
jgi:putative transposase